MNSLRLCLKAWVVDWQMLLSQDESDDESTRPLAESLLTAVSDLLFCPDFTVESHCRTTAVKPSPSTSISTYSGREPPANTERDTQNDVEVTSSSFCFNNDTVCNLPFNKMVTLLNNIGKTVSKIAQTTLKKSVENVLTFTFYAFGRFAFILSNLLCIV